MNRSCEKKTVSTKKPRISGNVPEKLKHDAERLARIRRRSVSNLLETLLAKEIEEAYQTGELPKISPEE